MLEPLQDSWLSMSNGFVRPISPHLWIYHRRQPKHLTFRTGMNLHRFARTGTTQWLYLMSTSSWQFFFNPSIACSKHNALLEFVSLEVHHFPNEADSKIQGAFVGKSDKAKSDKPKLYVKVQRAHDLRNMEPRLQLLTFWKIGRREDHDVVWRLWINVKEIVFNSPHVFWTKSQLIPDPQLSEPVTLRTVQSLSINQPTIFRPASLEGICMKTQDFGAFFGNKSDPYVVVRFGSEETLVEPDH